FEATSFFVMRNFIKEEIIKYDNAYPYVFGLILRTTSSITNVQTKHRARAEGKSGYTLRKLFSLWMNGFTAFSVKPLRVATVLGIFFACIGFISAVAIIINKLIDPQIQVGWSSIMAVVLFVGGIIMLILGIIGEYVGRQYVSINKAPQYVIRDTINTDADSKIL
ncbi:MAG: glycosyltransferase, partial [Bacillota bacterium]